eukprot:1157763-Pelagomonas_calceolata.AAC.4
MSFTLERRQIVSAQCVMASALKKERLSMLLQRDFLLKFFFNLLIFAAGKWTRSWKKWGLFGGPWTNMAHASNAELQRCVCSS